MTLRLKNIIYSLGLLSALFLVYYYRQNSESTLVAISGNTMGTTYHISYFDEEQRNFKNDIDSILVVFNNSLNTYLPNS
jgi:thiamine biosynthesis lipoprotein